MAATNITLTNGVYEYTSDGNETVFQLFRPNNDANPVVKFSVLATVDASLPYVKIGESEATESKSAIFSIDVPDQVKVRIESSSDVVSGMKMSV